MLVRIAEAVSHGASFVVAIVPSEFTTPKTGPAMISRIQRHRPTMPIMLVSIEDNGPRAYAPFETHVLLSLLQLENLQLELLDLEAAILEPELPF